MSRAKKFFILTLPLILGSLLFVSCSVYLPDATEQPNTPPAATSDLAQPVPSPEASLTVFPTIESLNTIKIDPDQLKGQVVQFWHPWTGFEQNGMDELIQEFNDTNEWGIQVKAEAFVDLDDLWKQASDAQKAGQAPDLVVGTLHQILTLDAQQPLVDLAGYVNDPVWGLTSQEQADYFPVIWNSDQVGGRRLGFPSLRTGQVIFYNSSWAKELGFSQPPNNPDEFRKQACAAAKSNQSDENPENDGTGGWIISTQPGSGLGWLRAFGVPVEREDGQGYQFNPPETEKAFLFLRDLYDRDCAWLPESEFAEGDFASRRGLFAAGSLSDLPYYTQEFKRQQNKDTWTILPFPSDTQPVFPISGQSYSILPRTDESQLASWLFVRWLSQPENAAKWIESTHSLPLRQEVFNRLESFRKDNPQWETGVNLLSQGSAEPPYASWSQVRWAVQDAVTQVFRSYFSKDGVPDLVKFLQRTADSLHAVQEK